MNNIHKFQSNAVIAYRNVKNSIIWDDDTYTEIKFEHADKIGEWNGSSIFDLLTVLSNFSNKLKKSPYHNITSDRKVAICTPTSLISQRVGGYLWKRKKINPTFAKQFPYFIDNNGLALIFPVMQEIKRFRNSWETNTSDEIESFENYYIIPANKIVDFVSLFKEEEKLVEKNRKKEPMKREESMQSFLDRAHYFNANLDKINAIKIESIQNVDINKIMNLSEGIGEPLPIEDAFDLGCSVDQLQQVVDYYINPNTATTRSHGYFSGLSIQNLLLLENQLVESGYIEKDKYGSRYKRTVKGNALRMKKRTKRMNIKQMTDLRDKLIKNYLSCFDSDIIFCKPIFLGFFGSTLDKDKESFGDIDVTINLETVEKLMEKHRHDDIFSMEAKLEYFNKISKLKEEGLLSCRIPKPLKDPYAYESLRDYGERVTKAILQSNNSLISIHKVGEILSIKAKVEVHYIGNNKQHHPFICTTDNCEEKLGIKVNLANYSKVA